MGSGVGEGVRDRRKCSLANRVRIACADQEDEAGSRLRPLWQRLRRPFELLWQDGLAQVDPAHPP
jgi:hypothetical protein